MVTHTPIPYFMQQTIDGLQRWDRAVGRVQHEDAKGA